MGFSLLDDTSSNNSWCNYPVVLQRAAKRQVGRLFGTGVLSMVNVSLRTFKELTKPAEQRLMAVPK